MEWFEKRENVDRYLSMSEGFDGRYLVDLLKNYLKKNSTLLELGMGPGRDLDLLKKQFRVTGSDRSHLFLDLYRDKHKDADLICLDAAELNTERKFEAIYSNKVLHHLSTGELKTSFHNQKRILKEGGIALHSFWSGDSEEFIEGVRFVYYTPEKLKTFCKGFKILSLTTYTEMEEGDSLCLIMQKLPEDEKSE